MSKGKPIRSDVPEFVHIELKKMPGSKKANSERVLIDWARRQQRKERNKDE